MAEQDLERQRSSFGVVARPSDGALHGAEPGTLSSLVDRYPVLEAVRPAVREAFELLASAFRTGRKVLVCGNGGSAADAEHIAGELMKGISRRRRLPEETARRLEASLPAELAAYLSEHLEPALPTISLVGGTSLPSAVANDTAPDMVFAQQVHGYGHPGDVLWALSTSGRSRNVVLAAATARAAGLRVLAMTGRSASMLGDLADVCIAVPADATTEAQELHLPVYHALCQALEQELTHG